jgi:hypothetical protein
LCLNEVASPRRASTIRDVLRRPFGSTADLGPVFLANVVVDLDRNALAIEPI